MSTFSVVGAYWMSCIRSFWKITLPGVIARLRPTSNIEVSVWRIFRSPPPASMSSASMCMPRARLSALRAERLAQQLGIGQHEVRRRDRIDDLAHVELGLLLGMRVEPLGVLDQVVGPFHRQQIGLLEEIEELVARPFRVGEALVARVGRRHRLRLLRPPCASPQWPRDRDRTCRARTAVRPRAAGPSASIRRPGRAFSRHRRTRRIRPRCGLARAASCRPRAPCRPASIMRARFLANSSISRVLALDRVRWGSHLGASFTSFRSGLAGSRSTYTFTWVCTVPVQDAYRETLFSPGSTGNSVAGPRLPVGFGHILAEYRWLACN